MRRNRFTACFIAIAPLLACSSPLFAQIDHRFTLQGGGGGSVVAGPIGHRLDSGWHLQAGAGYNLTSHLSVLGEFSFDRLGLTQSFIQAAQVPDGDAHVLSLTVDPMYHFNLSGKWGAYVIGGGGFYRRTIQFTQPTTQIVDVFDPFFGFFPTEVPTSEVLASFSRNAGGVNVGVGITYALGDSGAKLFFETRYHHAFTAGTATQYLPITVGIGW